ncbi:tetratricopeptide repeat protein [Streptomyces sioyaensis]|uniref:ATP-binding protein n=1 Tax=Streptomyces sioyaensis TaxID=67364 RepID=UPI001F1C4621|nr:tetratricopeptide repeat protein [Streptomyces sioyaensis]MCF3176031.1 tetratricopeptide repeat protein [Streptomyces sioyaensis]
MRRLTRPGPAARPSPERLRAPRRPGNLPAELNRFIGRGDELAALARELAAARLVTLTGLGGVGKSRLAGHSAAILQDRFSDGVWLVELASLREAHLLDHAVAEVLAPAGYGGRPVRAALCEHLADRELLLVLDGYEHLVDACAELTAELLRRAPGLRVLAAGRRPLGLGGERIVPLAPMNTAEASALFADRAASVVAGFTVGPSDEAAVGELCDRLDGIPLALELAAGRLRALSVAQVLHRLDDRFRLLTGNARGALPRHQTLRTAIGWSHELCTPAERLLWARLSVFAGQFDLEAAEYVCSGPELPADELLDVLAELVAQSVLVREETAAGVRYRMLDTVRDYGAGWLAATGDGDRLRRRHRDWYLGLATWCELDWFSPRQAEIAARIEAELPNLRVALEQSLQSPADSHLGQYLAGTLWFYWVACGRLAEGRHWLDRALELESDHDDARMKALWVAGYVALLQGDTVAALGSLQRCRDEAERTGNATTAAYALQRTGCLALICDDMPRAEELLRRALRRYREIGELNSTVLMGQVELAMALTFQGELADAVRLCEGVLEVCEDHGERWTLAYAQFVLACAAWSRGDGGRARALLEKCLAIEHSFGDLLGAVLAIELLAQVTLGEGDAAEAAVLQGAAARLWSSVGLPLFGSRHFHQPHARCAEQARERLGSERYEHCLRVGGRLDLDAAVARALRSAGPGSTGGRAVRRTASGTNEPAASPSASGGETAG